MEGNNVAAHGMAPPVMNATAASLLGFLIAGPQSGYTLAVTIQSTIGNFWNVTRSQVYRELRSLEVAGFVRVGTTGVRDRRPYALTPLGHRAFETWIAREPGDENIRFPVLLSTFFGDHVPPERLRAVLRQSRIAHERRLAGYRERIQTIGDTRPFPARTLRFGIMYEEMVLAWFTSMEDEGLL